MDWYGGVGHAKELSKTDFVRLKRECLYAPMPSSVFGYAVNEMMMIKNVDFYTFVIKILALLVLNGIVIFLQWSLLSYLSTNLGSDKTCPNDFLELRSIVLSALLIHVSPSFIDWLIEVSAIFDCENVIIDVEDDIIIEKTITPFKERIVAGLLSLSIIVTELYIWWTVINHAVSSILWAKNPDEIVSDGLATIFVNEIDNIAFSLLVPGRVKTKHAKQLFRLPHWPSDEIRPSKITFTRYCKDQNLNGFVLAAASFAAVSTMHGKCDWMQLSTQQFLKTWFTADRAFIPFLLIVLACMKFKLK